MPVLTRLRPVSYVLLGSHHISREKKLFHPSWVADPNGKHRCIVTPTAQMSLLDAREASAFGLFRPNVAKSIIAQLIRGVACLHGEDILHGGM